jgi:uncharacterized protein YacL
VFVVPRVVVEELQRIADSQDKNRRGRGRRGLDRLKDLQGLAEVQLLRGPVDEGVEADRQLIDLAKSRGGKLVTVDYNLQKVADVEGVQTLNLNELAEALRAQLIPGEALQVKIVRAGEGPNQGVGYLPDGTMVVVEGGRNRKGDTLSTIVTSSIQSSAGRMIFARVADGEPPAAEAAPPGAPGPG